MDRCNVESRRRYLGRPLGYERRALPPAPLTRVVDQQHFLISRDQNLRQRVAARQCFRRRVILAEDLSDMRGGTPACERLGIGKFASRRRKGSPCRTWCFCRWPWTFAGTSPPNS